VQRTAKKERFVGVIPMCYDILTLVIVIGADMSDQANVQSASSQNRNQQRRVLIVGGVAGGASCAARLRRLDESVEIVMFDRGPYVSFANCGLPYYVGNVISDERRLLVASPDMFHDRFNIQVHTDTEVTGVDPSARAITVRDGRTGNSCTERYDALVLSPGAAPIRPAVPGVDLPGVFAVRSIPDSRRIRSWIVDRDAKTAVVVGGGFIGLEMVENLIQRGLSAAILEKLPQVMPPLDNEMAVPLSEHLIAKMEILAGGQALLIDVFHTGGEMLRLPLLPAPVSYTFTVPVDPSLCGVTLSTQAVHLLGARPFALSNAIELTVCG
jgi:NADPH-dependent 2,4-dienoyl-CoA reductase/sulfur reductase-like enzyme